MRICPFLVALGLLLPGLAANPVQAAGNTAPIRLAQAEPSPQRPNLFRFLFGGGNRDREAAPPAEEKAAPSRPARQRATRPNRSTTTTRRRSGRSKARIVSAPVPTYDGPVSNVLVVGDFMAQALADGLVAAFQDNPEIQIVDAAEGASGLVRADYFDWVGELPALVARYDPAAIVVMIGANDSQPFRTGSGRIQTGGEEWRAAYVARVGEFIAALAEAGKPALWAGLVPVSKAGLSRDYSEFNTIYQEAAAAAAMPYVSLWDGFADETGNFAASGPDINGQNRRLRINDGLNFTTAGKRKLAFFLEQNVRQIVRDGTVPQFALATHGATEVRARISPMIALDTLSVPAGTALATFPGPEPEPAPTAGDTATDAGTNTSANTGSDADAPVPAADGGATVAGNVATAIGPAATDEAKGTSPVDTANAAYRPPPPGRVDDYSWPRPVRVLSDEAEEIAAAGEVDSGVKPKDAGSAASSGEAGSRP